MQALAIVFYERIMPGSQLANRLQDNGFRVTTVNGVESLTEAVQREMPMILFVELTTGKTVLPTIQALKADPATNHIPIVAFAPDNSPSSLAAAQKAGANLALTDTALLNHLPQWIEQALHFD